MQHVINSTSFSRLAVVLMTGCRAGYVPPGPRYECPALPLHKDLLYPCKCTSGSDAGLYVTCDQTNLASLSVGLANLGSLNYPVEELIISSCNFGKITDCPMKIFSTVNEKTCFCIVWHIVYNLFIITVKYIVVNNYKIFTLHVPSK